MNTLNKDNTICQQNYCTGCQACENICPKQAISMKENEYGFLYPTIQQDKCINCNLCRNVCSNISRIQKNKYIKTLALQSKDNYLIKKSSSGGMFVELAKFVLNKGGVVFGCAMERVEDGFDVKHIYIEDAKDLYKLQGSKYVQSRIGNTIKDAKEFLDKGRFVLYSGTPCQIAGLKAYLKQDYDKLLTVDLSCEGTPSLNIFNDYIKYLEKNVIKSKIVDFKFRSKKHFGWSTSGFVAIYKKGNKIKEKILPQNLSSYFSYFLSGSILQERCFSCKFTGLKRQSDITIADAWGIEKEYPELIKKKFNKKRGISLVLINSSKGSAIFEKIKHDLISEEIDINRLRKYNHPFRHPSIKPANKETIIQIYKKEGYIGIDNKFKQDLGNKYYYCVLKNHTPEFIKNIIKFFKPKQEKVDCLLLTWYNWKNYGSVLTAYALYKVIKDFGYSVKQIQAFEPIGYAKSFANKYFEQTNLCVNNKCFSRLNNLSETFIVGADNQLDYGALGIDVFRNLLNFADKNSKKLLISGSFGSWNWNENEKTMKILKNLYQRFDFVSVRENIAQQKMKEVFNIDVEWFMDPVFFLKKDEYLKLAESAFKHDYSNSIMSYILYPNREADKIIQYLNKDDKYKINYFKGNQAAPFHEKDKSKSVENWIKSILTSKYIVTDSFHCVAFCIILNRPVICIKNACDISRFLSTFEKFKIDMPIYSSFEDYLSQKVSYNQLDWEVINKNIEKERRAVLKIIQKELEKPMFKTVEHFDIENLFLQYRKGYYKMQDVGYRKNAFLFKILIKPFIIPIVRFFKYRNLQK